MTRKQLSKESERVIREAMGCTGKEPHMEDRKMSGLWLR